MQTICIDNTDLPLHRQRWFAQQQQHNNMTVTAPATDAAWKAVDLFGGAITAQFPQCFGDISDVRPVPDHQEVRQDRG